MPDSNFCGMAGLPDFSAPPADNREHKAERGATSELRSTEWLDLRVKRWLDTWAPHCGASRKTFEGQWRAMMADIFDSIEERAEAAMMKTHKLEGMHYAALSAVRRELQLRSRSSIVLDRTPKE